MFYWYYWAGVVNTSLREDINPVRHVWHAGWHWWWHVNKLIPTSSANRLVPPRMSVAILLRANWVTSLLDAFVRKTTSSANACLQLPSFQHEVIPHFKVWSSYRTHDGKLCTHDDLMNTFGNLIWYLFFTYSYLWCSMRSAICTFFKLSEQDVH